MKKLFICLAAILLISETFLPHLTNAQSPESMSFQAIVRNSNDQLVTSHAVGMKISILLGSVTGSPVYVETQTPTTNSNGMITVEIGDGSVVSGVFSSIVWANGHYFIKTEIDPTGSTNYSITGTSQLLSVPYALYAKTTGSTDYGNLTNKPSLFDGAWTSITGKPTSISGYEIVDFDFTGAVANDLLKFDGNKWVKFTPTYLTSEADSSVTNELQKLVLNSGQLTISGTGGNTVLFTNWDTIATDDVMIAGDQTIGGNKTFSALVQANNGINANNKKITSVADPLNDGDAVNKAYVDALKTQVLKLEDMLIASGQFVLMDIEGNQYSTVKIDTQIWMAENLKTTRYNDGTAIPEGMYPTPSTPAYCWFDNLEATYKNIYGGLYNWYAVNTGKLCPTGWHVPNVTEWTSLMNFLGGNEVAGGKIKEAGTAHWYSPNTGATNESGFTALPGGMCFNEDAFFYHLREVVYFWLATEFDAATAWAYYTTNTVATLGGYNCNKGNGISVRCKKD